MDKDPTHILSSLVVFLVIGDLQPDIGLRPHSAHVKHHRLFVDHARITHVHLVWESRMQASGLLADSSYMRGRFRQFESKVMRLNQTDHFFTRDLALTSIENKNQIQCHLISAHIDLNRTKADRWRVLLILERLAAL
jgi:hypothetical protein